MTPDDRRQVEARNAGDRAAEKTTRNGILALFAVAFALLIGLLLLAGLV